MTEVLNWSFLILLVYNNIDTYIIGQSSILTNDNYN